MITSHLEAKWHAKLRALEIEEAIERARLERRPCLYRAADAQIWRELAAWHDRIDKGRPTRVYSE